MNRCYREKEGDCGELIYKNKWERRLYRNHSGKYLWDGSYTMEAAFIVPMILGILYAWMFQLFYLRDCAVMSGMLMDFTIQAQTGVEEEADEERNRELIQACLWITRITTFQQTETRLLEKQKIEGSATWHIPVMEQFLENHFHNAIEEKLPRTHPESVLRYRNEDDE